MARPPLTGHNTIFLDATGPPQQGRRRGPLSEAHALVEGGGHHIGTHEEYVRQRGLDTSICKEHRIRPGGTGKRKVGDRRID